MFQFKHADPKQHTQKSYILPHLISGSVINRIIGYLYIRTHRNALCSHDLHVRGVGYCGGVRVSHARNETAKDIRKISSSNFFYLMNESENMALVQQMPVETKVSQWMPPMSRIMPPSRGGYTTLEHIAAFFSNSPTGALSNQSTTDDWVPNGSFVTSRGELRKARSFPKVKHDEPKKPCIFSERQTLRKSKSVRFADSQGLPLAAVHPLTSADSSYTRNIIVPYDDDDIFGDVAPARKGKPEIKHTSLHVTAVCTQQLSYTSTCSYVRKFNFAQPGTEPDFFDRVNTQKACLESLRSERRALHGIVRVANIAYEKSVTVRWTVDKWQNFHESRATYVPCSSDGSTDSFAFELPVNGEDVEFAICYQCKGQDYWDNNRGRNYIVYSTPQKE